MTTIVAACEAAIDPARGDQWIRLYCYASGVCNALDSRHRNRDSGLMEGPFTTGNDWNQPPLELRNELNGTDPKSPKVRELLNKFAEWFNRNEEKLKAEAAKESSDLERVRKQLMSLEP
jgi:hypothetical protein